MAMQGQLRGADGPFAGVSTDSRSIRNGELFIALSGPNFDGGDFVGQALRKGAAAAVVSQPVGEPVAQIVVADTRKALGMLARHWRRQQPATVVGITGSNGKTTLKELTAACLSRAGSTLATEGNLNNDVGVPLMLLRIRPEHRYAVIEMGANHVGEIAGLVRMACPDVVAITNAGPAHLEGFGSLEGVARGKGEILQGDPRPDCAVLNADDPFFDFWRSLVGDARTVSFGLSASADVRGDGIVVGRDRTDFQLHIGSECVAVSLALAGEHNVRNACAAAAIASCLGVAAREVAAALGGAQPVGGRLQPVTGRNGATLYDDSYNANPLSVVAGARFLASLPGHAWVILGDMKELGSEAAQLHSEAGRQIRETGVERLFATGELCRHAVEAFGPGAVWFADAEELAASVQRELAGDVSVLVKGSRSMRMERVVDVLRAPAPIRKEA